MTMLMVSAGTASDWMGVLPHIRLYYTTLYYVMSSIIFIVIQYDYPVSHPLSALRLYYHAPASPYKRVLLLRQSPCGYTVSEYSATPPRLHR